jgi:co-chaperonin GroES (HSP10)
MKTIQPVGDYILIESVEYKMPKERKSKGGIIMVEAAPGQPGIDTRPTHYWVIKGVGPDVDDRRYDVRVGMKVLFNDYNVKKMKDYDEDVEYGLIQQKDIMAYYKDE